MNIARKNVFCFTHSADYDGIFSGEIVRAYYKNSVKIIPITYADKEVHTIFNDYNLKDAIVIICDFSFPNEIMQELTDICNTVIWCDHHKTSIERITALQCYQNIKGIQDIRYSGAELIWAYLYNNKQIDDMSNEPTIIKSIGAYDTWRFSNEDEKLQCLIMQNGLRSIGITFNSIEFSILLHSLIEKQHDKYDELMSHVMKIGKAKLDYQYEFKYHLYEKMFQTKTLSKYTCCTINGSGSSEMFKYCYDPQLHDCCIRYAQSKNGKWGYSVYVLNDKIDRYDATEIAKCISSESGGHRGVAGASSDLNIFN